MDSNLVDFNAPLSRPPSYSETFPNAGIQLYNQFYQNNPYMFNTTHPWYPYPMLPSQYPPYAIPMPSTTDVNKNAVPAVSYGKKPRVLFDKEVKDALLERFEKDAHIKLPERNVFAESLGLTGEQVKIWFQNRRYKLRKQGKHGGEVDSDHDASASSSSLSNSFRSSELEENGGYSADNTKTSSLPPNVFLNPMDSKPDVVDLPYKNVSETTIPAWQQDYQFRPMLPMLPTSDNTPYYNSYYPQL